MFQKSIFISILIISYLFITPLDAEDIIHLKTGQTLSGTILEKNDEFIRIRTSKGTYRILQKQIKGNETPSDKRNKKAEAIEKPKILLYEYPSKKNKPSNKYKSKKSSKHVELFVTEWCPYCNKLESYLKRNKIKYTKYDIEKSVYGKKLYRHMGGKGVPLTRVGGKKVIRGYNPKAIVAALKN